MLSSNLLILSSDKFFNPLPKLLYSIVSAIEKLKKSLCFSVFKLCVEKKR